MSDLGTAEWRAMDADFTEDDQYLLSRGVFFGGSGHPMWSKKVGIPITSRPESHSLIVGKTRAGKGINVVIPTLLRVNGPTSILCIDPKGENAAITARPRALFNYIRIMNPWGELGDTYQRLGFPPATYNPLDMLAPGDLNSVSIAKSMGRVMSPSAPGDHQPFWADSAADLIAATLLWLVDQDPKDEPEKSLRRAAQILSRGRKDFVKNYVTRMAASEAFDGAISMLASPFLDMVDVTFGGIMSHVGQAVSFLADPMIARATMTSNFSMAELTGAGRKAPATLYLVVPWDKLETQRVWLRLMITAGMAVFKRKPQGAKYRCLFLIDEFPALGKIPGIDKEAAAMAGPGVDFAFIAQNLEDIRREYGPAADGIIGNCAYKWFCNIDDLKTAEYLSKTLGKKTVLIQNSSSNTGENKGHSPTGWTEGESTGESTSSSQHARDLLTPDEIINLGSGTAILLAPGDNFRNALHPVPYWELKETFAAYPGAFPVVYYDRNLTLPPEKYQCPPMPPPIPWDRRTEQPPQPPAPTYSGSKNDDPSVYAPPETQPQKPRPPIDLTLYGPPELREPGKPPQPPPISQHAAEEDPASNYDPFAYAPPEIREQLREEFRNLQKKKPQS